MDEILYIQTQEDISLLARTVLKMPLKEFIAAAEHADSIGPYVDPTLWIKAAPKLGDILDLARSLRNFQDLVLMKIALTKEVNHETH